MKCPENIILIRWLAGELSASEQDRIKSHVEQCPACQSACADLKEAWNQLGEWKIDLPQVDLAGKILAELDSAALAQQPIDRSWLHQQGLLHIAASIIVGLGLGIGAGYRVPTEKKRSDRNSIYAINDQQISEQLGLAIFGSDSATGLTRALDAPTQSNQPEVQ